MFNWPPFAKGLADGVDLTFQSFDQEKLSFEDARGEAKIAQQSVEAQITLAREENTKSRELSFKFTADPDLIAAMNAADAYAASFDVD